MYVIQTMYFDFIKKMCNLILSFYVQQWLDRIILVDKNPRKKQICLIYFAIVIKGDSSCFREGIFYNCT